MYIHGENWNSGGVSQTINVELNTCQQPPCPRGSQVLLTQSIPFNSDGTFTSSSVPLKRDLVGDYWITASNQVPNNIAKDGSPMKADEALTFGDKKLGDAGALHLNIVRPCIVVTLNDPASTTPPEQAPSNCAQSSSKPISVTAGASFYLQGFHWSLSDKHTMTVKITCDQRSKCAGQKLPQIGSFMLQENQQGYFWQRVKVPDDSTGTYTINVTEDALQYGSSLKVLITPPTATAPTNNILPLLALLPALVSLLLYIIMQRRRTVQTAAATRRMPGGPGPTTARSSLPPPVIRQQPGGRR